MFPLIVLLQLPRKGGRSLPALVNVVSRFLAMFVLAASLLPGNVGQAQVQDRISPDADLSQMRSLANHHPAWANVANDRGALPGDQQVEHLTLVLARSADRESALRALLAEQQNPASSNYHHWLTPAEIGWRYGLSSHDIGAIKGWLQAQRLQVNWITPSQMFIDFSGKAADVGQAFHTNLHSYNVSGHDRVSVDSDPMVPAAMSPLIKGIKGLFTIEDRPFHSVRTAGSDSPELTLNGTTHFVSPVDFATIYDVPSAYAGARQTIGIVGRSRTDSADFTQFEQKTGVTFIGPHEVVPTAYGGVDPGPAYTSPPAAGVDTGEQFEATLDVTRAGTIAPGAQLLLVVATSASGGIEADAQYLVQGAPSVQVMTISFGACESSAGPSGVNFWDTLFQQAAAEGISVFVSSGDSGASGCDRAFTTPPANPSANSPNYICSSSYATCVGGTEFNDTSNPSQYWTSDNGATLGSARSYIPEGGWNEPLDSTSKPEIAASGGGVSKVIATPAWQQGTGVPSARSGRYTPDVSFTSSGHDGYFVCFAAGGGDCVPSSTGSYHFDIASGTSAAAPSMAAVAALLDDKLIVAQGNLNPEIYRLAASDTAAFHDVTVASSGVSGCSVNVPSMCNNSAAGPTGLSGGLPGYLITTGYDEVTGLGSLDVAKFLDAYAATRVAPTLTLSLSSTSITSAQQLTVTVGITGTATIPPTGTIVLTSGKYTSTPSISNVTTTFVIPAATLAPGNDTLTAAFTPDNESSVAYDSATASTQVTVTTVPLVTPAVQVSPSSASVTTAQVLLIKVIILGKDGDQVPTGAVTLTSGSYTSAAMALLNGQATIDVPVQQLALDSDTLIVRYAPDAISAPIYADASGTTTVTVTAAVKSTPSVRVMPSLTTVTTQQPLSVAVAVSGGAGTQPPTGTIVLTSATYTSAAIGLTVGSATVSIPAGVLTVGTDTLSVSYTPDSGSSAIYSSATGSGTVTVNSVPKVTPDIQLTTSSANYTTADDVRVQIILRSSGVQTPTGTITITSGSYTSGPATLVNGLLNVDIPPNVLPVGADPLTANYVPDANSSIYFNAASGSTTVTITTAQPPTFTISGPTVSLVPGATAGNTTAVTVTPMAGFNGSVALSASVTSSPANAQNLPVVSFGSQSSVNITGTAAATATLTITTKAATQAAAERPLRPGAVWYAVGGTSLALVLMTGVPARKRRWRAMLGMFVLLLAIGGSMAGCGAGSKSTMGGPTFPGTTPGTYTVTVTGISGSTTETGTVTVIVQ
jgi:subtilase family serine protease